MPEEEKKDVIGVKKGDLKMTGREPKSCCFKRYPSPIENNTALDPSATMKIDENKNVCPVLSQFRLFFSQVNS